MGNNYKPLQTGFTRVFVIAGRARGDRKPEYYSSLKMGGVSQSYGDTTKIEIPDPNQYGAYLEVDRIRGSQERASFSLSGRFAATLKSRLLEIGRAGLALDVQMHVGDTTDPTSFNTFNKAIICEDALVTQHSTDDLGALESGENAAINESADLTARSYYEVVPLSFSSKNNDIVTNPVTGVCVLDAGLNDASQIKFFAVTNAAGGSPSTPADCLFSLDGGRNFKAHDVDGFTATDNATGVAVVGDYVVVTSNSGGGICYALVQDFIDGIDPLFSKVTTGFVTGRMPNAIFSVGRKAFLVGDYGHVYFMEDPTSGVVVLDSGGATISKLNAVHAMDEDNAIAGGNDGVIIKTTDRYSWDVTGTKPFGAGGHVLGVFMKSKTEWWAVSTTGGVAYTINAGKSWTAKSMPGTAPTKMDAIWFVTDSVGYAAGIVSGKARLYRTFDGGYSWVVLPESIGTMPTATEFYAVVASDLDVNLVVTVGANSTDGVIVVGRGS